MKTGGLEGMIRNTFGLLWEGGGAKGAFGVGFLLKLKERLPELTFKILSGASVGGINILPVCIDDYELLKESWEEFKRHKALKLRLFPTIFDTGEMRKFFHYLIEEKNLFERLMESDNTCLILSVSKRKGPIVFTNKDLSGSSFRYYKMKSREDLLIALLGTSSIPYFFPSVEFNGEILIDGGVYSPLPLEPLVEVSDVKKIVAIVHEPFGNWKVSSTYSFLHPFNALIENVTRKLVKKEMDKWSREGTYIFKFRDREIFLVYPEEELSAVLDFSEKAINRNLRIGEETFEKIGKDVVKFLLGDKSES